MKTNKTNHVLKRTMDEHRKMINRHKIIHPNKTNHRDIHRTNCLYIEEYTGMKHISPIQTHKKLDKQTGNLGKV